MDLNAFCAAYADEVRKYINDGAVPCAIGNGWMEIQDAESYIYIKQAESYVIPPEIIELLQIEQVNKIAAHELTFKLNKCIPWDNCRITAFNNIPLRELVTVCSICGVDTAANYSGMFEGNVCLGCHPPNQKGKLYDIRDFNAIDWILFCNSINSRFSDTEIYVNCNPRSKHYGKVMFPKHGYFGRFSLHTISIQSFIDHIVKWIQYAGTPSIDRCMKYLDTEQPFSHFSPYSEHGGNITPRFVLENTHLEVSERVVGRIMHDMYYYKFATGMQIDEINERCAKLKTEKVFGNHTINIINKNIICNLISDDKNVDCFDLCLH